jgi:mono/diheme cytochrome c family protein
MNRLSGLSLLALALMACGGPSEPHTCAQPEDPSPDALPTTLAETGLFCDGAYEDSAWFFEPRWPLWTDGLEKRRAALLPDGSPILSREDGSWDAPIGTRLSKTIFVAGEPIETRLSWRTQDGWLFGAYQWDGDSAALALDGAVTEDGYEIPDSNACLSCHGAEPKPNAFNAWQLKNAPVGLDTDSMIDAKILRGPGTETPVELPGDGAITAAIGYLATNCGSCHSDRGIASGLDLRLDLSWPIAQDIESTPFWQTAVAMPALTTDAVLVSPGAPAESFLFQRMTGEGDLRMPPLGTEIHDAAGIAIVEAAIESLR